MTDEAVAQAPKRRPLRALLDWFWRGQALADAKREQEAERPLALIAERAAIAAEVGEQTLDPPRPWVESGAERVAASLFVESIVWSLRLEARETSGSGGLRSALGPAELEELLRRQQPRLLEAARTADTLERVQAHVLERAYDTARAGSPEAKHAARELGAVAAALLDQGPRAHAKITRALGQRALRMGGLLALLVASAFGARAWADRAERAADLSLGKPWKTSSSYEAVAQSPSRERPAGKGYFFHTQEERGPWLELDLLKPQSFSKVRVFNRTDCCTERAAPLVIEVSNDHERWTQVARRSEPFSSFRANFQPTTARWVRLSAPRRTYLHLEDVRILP